MCGLRFSLSATAFFQVNTCAAEVLYRLAGEWASPTGKSLLLDVCCGTGTIGRGLHSWVMEQVSNECHTLSGESGRVSHQFDTHSGESRRVSDHCL